MKKTTSLDPRELEAKAVQVRAGICREAVRSSDGEACYEYRDPSTSRVFEIRRSETEDEAGRPAQQYFMSEMRPNGRIYDMETGHVYDEPRIRRVENTLGPNKLMAALADLGVDTVNMVFMGGGYGLGSIYHPSLEACAAAIATALLSDERYEYFKPLDEQARTRQALQEAKDSHSYWTAERTQQQQAQTEHGIFKGCRSMMGPLAEETKERILAYLNSPSQAGWLEVRGTCITGHGTLWQAWSAHDATAPKSGDVGYPSRDQLTAAIRAAVVQREAEIADRLAKTDRRGLRAV